MVPQSATLIRAFAEWVIRRRIPILVILLLLTGFSAHWYNKIPRDPSAEAMVLEDDPDLLAYNHFKSVFGNDEFILLATQVPDIFERQFMTDVEALRKEIEELPYIKETTAFTNIRSVRGSEDSIIVEPLIPEIPTTPEGMAEARKRALSEPDFVGNLYSADTRTIALLANLKNLPQGEDTTEMRTVITRAVRTIAAKADYARYDWRIAGTPVLKSDLAETQKKEGTKFEVIIFAMLSITLFFIFRMISGVVVTLVTVFSSIAILLAAHYFSGIPLSMVSTILTPLMMIYGISSAVHIQTHYALRVGEGLAKREALIVAVSIALVPCFFNAATTVAGFGSNLVSSIRPIREFAVFSGSGVMLSFVLAFLMIPAILSFFPAPGKATLRSHESGKRARLIEGLIRMIEGHYKVILVVCGVLLLVSIWGMSKITVETKLLEYFRPESPIRSAYTFIDENLSGISSLEIMVDTGDKDGMKDPEVLAKIGELTNYFRAKEPDITAILSLENFYRRINKALHGDDPAWARLPERRDEAAQLLLLYSMSGPESDLFNFTSNDYRYGRVSARLHTQSSKELEDLVLRVKDKTKTIFEPLEARGVKVNVTGSAVLYANMNASLVKGQLQSFGLSLFLITLMMLLVAGEWGLGLVSLIPNLLPIAYTMGLMGFLGYPLDSTTAMVAPIALGMAVDSTIHYMIRYRREYLRLKDHDEAMRESLRIIGRAMIGTSMPLAAGFLVLMSSEFLPVYVFGLLSGVVVILAMLFDLILTPVCIWLYKPTYQKPGLIDFVD